MKKTLIGLLLILLVAGCISFDQVKEGAETIKEKIDTELGVTGYDMKVGDSITVDGKTVKLESFNADYVTVFDVGGQQIEMHETQDPQIVSGIEITIKRFNYDATNLESNSVKVDIKKYVPELDHYIFYLEDEKEFFGHKIALARLYKEGSIDLMIDNVNPLTLMEEETKEIADIYITNIRPNFRAIASERYVIIKVSQKP